jgi:hypothetical protein
VESFLNPTEGIPPVRAKAVPLEGAVAEGSRDADESQDVVSGSIRGSDRQGHASEDDQPGGEILLHAVASNESLKEAVETLHLGAATDTRGCEVSGGPGKPWEEAGVDPREGEFVDAAVSFKGPAASSESPEETANAASGAAGSVGSAALSGGAEETVRGSLPASSKSSEETLRWGGGASAGETTVKREGAWNNAGAEQHCALSAVDTVASAAWAAAAPADDLIYQLTLPAITSDVGILSEASREVRTLIFSSF